MPYAIINGMTVKIDRAGRIVLPKPVRDRLGIRESSELDMEETREGITLKLAERGPSMVQRDGFWVHTGTLPSGFDIVQAIKDDREDRIRKLAGL
jgi:AbrB family looped-hinge helix DNA binding protein